jgi:hypothetical protein
MTVRTELESIDMALVKLRHDMDSLVDRMLGPKWMFARANLRRATDLLNAAGGHIRESHEHVPEALDMDD